MTTSYLGSLLIESGRMSLAAGVSLRGWAPGLSLFTKSPIVDNVMCQHGVWHIVRNREGSWIDDVFALMHSSEFEDMKSARYTVPVHPIASFQTWGKLYVTDTIYRKSDGTFKNVFDIHPGRWSLSACVKEGQTIPDRTKHEIAFFLISPYWFHGIHKMPHIEINQPEY